MKISRRKFIGLTLSGAAFLIFGRLLNLFKSNNDKVACYWKKSDKLAG